MYAHSRNIDTHAGIYTQAPQLKPITFGKCQFKYYLLWKTGQLPAPSPILVILSSQPYPPPPHSPQYLSDDTAITEGLPPDCELCGSVPSVVPQPWTALSTGPLNCCQLTEESFCEKEDGANRGLKRHLGAQPGPLRLQPVVMAVGEEVQPRRHVPRFQLPGITLLQVAHHLLSTYAPI